MIIQSSKIEYSQEAYEMKTVFINKNSERLIQDIKSFIGYYLGFGNFVFKDADGVYHGTARTIKEFESLLRSVSVQSIVFHARKNHFSLWLMARGEIKIAQKIAPYQISDFENEERLRSYLIESIENHRKEQNRGKIIDFDEASVLDDNNVFSMARGSLGGKGRGLAFVNTLLHNFNFKELLPNINIKSPVTIIIGTDEFEHFMEDNGLNEMYFRSFSYDEIKK